MHLWSCKECSRTTSHVTTTSKLNRMEDKIAVSRQTLLNMILILLLPWRFSTMTGDSCAHFWPFGVFVWLCHLCIGFGGAMHRTPLLWRWWDGFPLANQFWPVSSGKIWLKKFPSKPLTSFIQLIIIAVSVPMHAFFSFHQIFRVSFDPTRYGVLIGSTCTLAVTMFSQALFWGYQSSIVKGLDSHNDGQAFYDRESLSCGAGKYNATTCSSLPSWKGCDYYEGWETKSENAKNLLEMTL